MAESNPREQQASRPVRESGISIQEVFELHERVLARLGLLPGNPALESDLLLGAGSPEPASSRLLEKPRPTPVLDSNSRVVVETSGGEAAGKEKISERKG